MSPREIIAKVWSDAGGAAAALDHLSLTGADPALPSSFRVGSVAQAAIAVSTMAAAELWHLRCGRRQRAHVDMRHAAIDFRSERYLRIDGRPPPDPWDAIAGTYRCGDGRWVRLHTNFPHHRDGVLRLLECGADRDAVRAALTAWRAADFESAAAEAGLVVTTMRAPEEWAAHPQGRAVARLQLVAIEKIADAPAEPPAAAARPLDGVRVADFTRVIAGPVCGRTLAAHGADVLRISAPHLPFIAPLVIDTNRGKRAAHADLRDADDLAAVRRLIGAADIVVQSYRPGALDARGLSPAALAALRPGLIHVSLSAYGHAGPWASRRGFDSLVQTASGINHAEAVAAGRDRPKALPCQALDHASGYLMACGAMLALHRRATEGGSWRVRVSLARTGHWLQSLGRLDNGLACPDPAWGAIEDLVETRESGFGRLSAVRHAGQLSETPPGWHRPSMPLGSHRLAWSA